MMSPGSGSQSTSATESGTALVELVEIGVTGQDDAYNICADEIFYTKCFDNEKKSFKGNDECVKVDTLIEKTSNRNRRQ